MSTYSSFDFAVLGDGKLTSQREIASAGRLVGGLLSRVRGGGKKGVLVLHSGAHRKRGTALQRVLKVHRHGRSGLSGLGISIAGVMFWTVRRNEFKRYVRQIRGADEATCKRRKSTAEAVDLT